MPVMRNVLGVAGGCVIFHFVSPPPNIIYIPIDLAKGLLLNIFSILDFLSKIWEHFNINFF